ncbi:MAG: hypothetical protein WC761_00615 [Candidatus Paceibacterota bacterium]|jgi:hypothetical protein
MLWVVIVLLSLFSLVLLAALGFAMFHLWKFANIIMLLEDDFSEAIEGLGDVESALEKILGMQLFFDSKEVKLVVQEALTEVKTSRITVNRLIQKFVERSKQKYVVLMEEDTDEDLKERALQNRMEQPTLVPTRGESRPTRNDF